MFPHGKSHRIPELAPLPSTPDRMLKDLVRICPLPVFRKPPLGYPTTRSCMHHGKRFYWQTPSPFVYLSGKEGNSWNAVRVLAHEVGHALDYAGLHPARELIGWGRVGQSPYRVELAAAAYCHAFCLEMGLLRLKRTHAFLDLDAAYLGGFERGEHPRLEEVIQETLRNC